MTQKLTEEQQRAAHKIIKANRGDCLKNSNYLNCCDCPNFFDTCGLSPSIEFQSENLRRSQAWLDAHPATPQEPPKRRPTPEEMVVGAPVRVRLWDELVKDGKLSVYGHIQFPTIYFNKEMRQYCGNAYKVIKGGGYPHLDGCGDWTFIPEMLDYVEPEKLVDPKPVANAPTLDALRIIALEGQVDDLTKKLTASTKLCERQQRRLRAKWEAKHTTEEIEAWFDAGNGSAIHRDGKSTIRPKGHSSWMPATRGNLKL